MKDYFEKFTQNARKSLLAAQHVAEEMQSPVIASEHLLLGLLTNKECLAADILATADVTAQKVYVLLSFGGRGSSVSSTASDAAKITLAEETKGILTAAVNFAKKFGHFYVGTEHILLALITQETQAKQLIAKAGMDPAALQTQIENLFGQGNLQDDLEMAAAGRAKRSETPALDYFTTDLTQKARDKKLDPVIGRALEIERLIQILNRRTKNNPALIGEAGVGKTAIVEGLAQRIIEGDVPQTLINKRVLQLDMTGLLAGTKFRGEFEERIKQVINEIVKAGDAILFIDELHTIVGTGSAEGSLDAGQMLKPMLARGEIQTIGATTLDEYKKYIEKDSALERRFQPIVVNEPSPEETEKILQGVKKNYEDHHNVKITDEAIEAAVKLSTRYIADRFLPDKAIDLIDEAASGARIRAGFNSSDIKKMQDKLAALVNKKEKAVEGQKYEEAAKLRTDELRIQEKIEKAKKHSVRDDRVSIGKEEVAKIVGQWTNIPITELVQEEAQRYLQIEGEMKKRIVGQDEAVEVIAKSLRRNRAGISNPKRPIGCFMFLGPTGVGKTELCKVLAEVVFGRSDALVKMDMSEFMERHNVSRLIGAPPGYVGFEEAGKLTETIRRKPYSVVLFDEIEKANPEIFNILLQIFEDGCLTDAKGRRVDFRNTIVILTSNLGMQEFSRLGAMGFQAKSENEIENVERKYEELVAHIQSVLKESFRPEFLNRLDRVVVFKPLTTTAIRNIVDIELWKLAERLRDSELQLKVSSEAKELIAERGFSLEQGARPVRRVITDLIEDQLAEGLLAGEFSKGDTIEIESKDSEIILRSKVAKTVK